MPDEIAGRATLLLLGGILAGTGIGFLVSWLVEKAGTHVSTNWTGIAAGLAVFAAAMSWVVSDLYGVVQQRSQHVLVQGTLLSFEAVKLRQSPSGRVLRGNAPVVEFTAPDGQVHLARGLAGSLQRREPGSALAVLVDPANPKSAVIADFQNQYAALALFAGFCALAWLGVWWAWWQAVSPPVPDVWVPPAAVGQASGKRARSAARQHAQHLAQAARQARAAPPPSAFDAWRSGDNGQHWRRTLGRMGWATVAMSILGVWLLADAMHVGRAVAITLAGLATALACGALAALLRPGAHVGLTLLGHSIGVLAAGLFAGFVWALTAY